MLKRLCLVLWCLLPLPGMAAEVPMNLEIVAVVNDSPITSYALYNRLRLAILSGQLPDTPELRQRLTAPTLRTMIDEQLQRQEAERRGLRATDREVAAAVSRLEEQNRLPPGGLARLLDDGGVPQKTLRDQITAGLVWNKVLQRVVRPQVEIGDEEVDAAIARIQANAGRTEYLVSEIFLPIENTTQEADAQRFAADLVTQLRGGAPFANAARQFSQNSSAGAGGDIGWIQPGQLAPSLDRALTGMGRGMISDPIRTDDGIIILGVRDERVVLAGDPLATRVQLAQLFLPTTTPEAVLSDALAVRGQLRSCAQARTISDGWVYRDLAESTVGALPEWLRDGALQAPLGQPTPPLAAEGGILLVLVCSRTPALGEIDRVAVSNSIGQERFELQARRLLRDLRRDATIDLRS